MLNPLIATRTHRFGVVPFDQVKNEHFLDALQESVMSAHHKVENLKKSIEKVSFQNTIVFLEEVTDQIEILSGIFNNIYGAESNDEIEKIAQEFSPLVQKFFNDLLLDQKIFERVKTVWDNREKEKLSFEEKTLLEKYYKDFCRNGALLSDEKKNRLRAIDEQLTKLSLQFSSNLLKSTNEFSLVVTEVSRLEGLPQGALEAAQEEAKKQGKDGAYIFTLKFPSFQPFLSYVKDRELRKQLYQAYVTRAYQGGHDNTGVIKEIAALRLERAQLLGHKTHAHYVLDDRMAQTPEKVMDFLNHLTNSAHPFAEKELEEMQKFAWERDGISQLESWDRAYYGEHLKLQRFQIDDEILRPFFPLEKVVEGVFSVAQKLYGLKFNLLNDVPVYHPEVRVYEVVSSRGHVGLLYADFFPRSGKRQGAWMTDFRGQGMHQGKVERPHISIVCNFTRPTQDRPSLLSLNEVLTLFHEFGHALHGLLSQCTYRSVAGVNVKWDFVELPSQMLENWVYEKECLDLFARHYQTGESIPLSLIEKIKESSQFQEAMMTLRQLSYAFLDMAWHYQFTSESADNLEKFEHQAQGKTHLLPNSVTAIHSTAFSHIFSGGYSAGYYSYKWAEVLDADAFEYFKNKGIFNHEVATKFKENILEKGGSEPPMELYRRFRGRDPDPNALLRRAGLITSA